ncbi:hypothetical protein PW52_01720 [Tamlana sedimentorum]|uniref:Secretion system C-terminal sorting domain-containing protein n=1 Tax=Neotamlana sedimentorum TaxID=1435349 RepID=A0A0D7WER3_9FLAO|nr:T9SS type A sorting domain-containing protein [Tamlana sedimentorum]KJD37193.1 hypothetical protein PW52_01720 [Tamlana sedimentorum]
MRNLFTTLFLSATIAAIAQDVNLTDVFSDGGPTRLDNTSLSFTRNFSATPSTFSVFNYYPEESIYHASITYDNGQNDEGYVMRIGKGAQIYSFRNSVHGEIVPPQHRTNIASNGLHHTPFVDDVFQMVAASSRHTGTAPDIIHQAGSYVRLPEQVDENNHPFYSPLIAEHFDADDKSFTTVNWGQQPNTDKNLTLGYTADLMFYTRHKNIGNGVIQVDNILHNFGQQDFTFLDVPWGGVRHSSMPYLFVSNEDNSYSLQTPASFPVKEISIASTGGWIAYSSSQDGNGPSMGLVFTRDQSAGPGVIRWGEAIANDRDFYVLELIRFPQGNLSGGKSMQFRTFMVLGSSVDDVKSKILDSGLEGEAFITANNNTKDQTTDIHYQVTSSGSKFEVSETTQANSDLTLEATPFQNSLPVCLIEGADGTNRITTDLYTYSSFPYDRTALSWKLLGYSEQAVNFDVLGISEQVINKTDFKVYPNPVESIITIQGFANLTVVDLYDINGRILLSKIISNESETIDLSHLKSGTYYLKTNSGAKQLIVKK